LIVTVGADLCLAPLLAFLVGDDLLAYVAAVIGGGFALVLQYAGTARPCTTMLRRCRSRRLLL